MNQMIERQPGWLLRKLFKEGWAAGEKAALDGGAITNCPFGPCRGMADESHDDMRICGWVNGFVEQVIQADMESAYEFGFNASERPEFFTYSVPSPRVRAALVDGFLHGHLYDMVPVGGTQ